MFHRFLCSGIFVIFTSCHLNSVNASKKTVTNITKLVTDHYQSNCVIFLYTQGNLRRGTKEILRILSDLAKDVDYSFTVAGMTFKRFHEAYRVGVEFMRCNSPFILITHFDNETKSAIQRLSNGYLPRNVFWLTFLKSSSIPEFFENMKIPFDLQLIVVDIRNDRFAELYEVYRVAEDRPLRTPRLGRWTKLNGLELPKEIVYNRRHDLEGIVLKTGSTENYPIHYWVEQAQTAELKGYFPELWRELEDILNFTSLNYPSVDKVTGKPEKDGNWSGLVGMLQRREIDVAVSDFIMDTQRSHVVDFTRPLLKSRGPQDLSKYVIHGTQFRNSSITFQLGAVIPLVCSQRYYCMNAFSYQIFFKNVGNDFNWYSILRPFHTSTWLMVLLWIFIGSCSLTACHSFSYRFGVEKSVRLEDFDPINSAIFLTKALCNQGHPFVPSCIASRIIYLSAYVAACVLIPFYSAALISYLTSKTPSRPFDSLEELLTDGTYKLQTNSKTAEYTYFSEASNELLKAIYHKLMIQIPEDELPLNTRYGLDKVCSSHRLAHFGDMAVASPYLSAIHNGKKCDIVYLSQPISTIYSCMALTRNNPYKSVINHFLQKMEDSGLIDELHDRTFPMVPKIRPSGWSQVEMSDVLQIFIILLFGKVLALILLLIEIFSARGERFQPKKNRRKQDGVFGMYPKAVTKRRLYRAYF